VWLDHDDIEPGDEFAEALAEALAQSDNLLAIIGPDWLTAEKGGRRRLDDPEDWVRREVTEGLAGRAVVTPILVGNAQLPTIEELPEPLQALPGRQAIEVRPERFDDDVKDLIRRIGGWRRRWRGFPLWAWALAITALAGILLVAFLVRRNMAPLIDPQQVEAVAGVPEEIDLLSWVTDDRHGEFTLLSDPASLNEGSVENLGDGRVLYTAPRGFYGDDSFGFTVRDEGGLETTATAHVEVILGAMSGAFNVAVAELAVTGAEQEVGLDISEAVYDQIVQDLSDQRDVDVEVAGPGAVRVLPGDTPESRAKAAGELADRVEADVVVFGTVEVSEGLTDVAAEFFVSDRNLTGAEELAGVYPLDTVSLATTDPVAVRRRTAESLQPRILALTQLALGLSHYQLNEYTEAETLFEDALASWPGSNGREVVLSLLGNVTGLQADLDAAEVYYADALSLDSDYARARFGAAEVAYQRSRGRLCGSSGEADVALLEDAVAQFEEVADLTGPPLAFIPERARVEIGKIYECLFSNGGGHLEEAREILEAVIDDISGETRLVDLTADAHFSLGVYHLLKEDQEAAIAEFETAVDITRNDIRRRGFYYSMAVFYQCLLDQPERAESYYRQAEAIPGPPLDPLQCITS
jgi:tetratricopeptide (TPR) repeat protein